jgi:hypothetical protein
MTKTEKDPTITRKYKTTNKITFFEVKYRRMGKTQKQENKVIFSMPSTWKHTCWPDAEAKMGR